MTTTLKSIKITNNQWTHIIEKLRSTHPPSSLLLRSKMKDRLGFTPRFATGFEYNDTVILDFFSSESKFLFLLEFGDVISA